MKKQFCYKYPRPAVTVDVVIVTREAKPRVLLIRRKHDPFEGHWAIPGGFVDMDEGLEAAARRELHEETGVRTRKLTQLGTFGDPDRDPEDEPSASSISPGDAGKRPQASDDAAAVGWFCCHAAADLAFDHRSRSARQPARTVGEIFAPITRRRRYPATQRPS